MSHGIPRPSLCWEPCVAELWLDSLGSTGVPQYHQGGIEDTLREKNHDSFAYKKSDKGVS